MTGRRRFYPNRSNEFPKNNGETRLCDLPLALSGLYILRLVMESSGIPFPFF